MDAATAAKLNGRPRSMVMPTFSAIAMPASSSPAPKPPLNQMANEDDLKITKGSTKIYTYYGDSGKPVNCYYCPNCTSHIYHHQTVLGPKIVVRTGLLQGSEKFPVVAEIFGKDRLSWQPELAKTFSGPPEH
ncbi:hypothetical protein ABVK25_002799 [Lepraria finkii]|uniref:CENP-V/GFA domain-containing protein n=1 Tax=Lepraria finkii TaxID=1340010 RepID=A0ABR4BHC0_9LECA